jgi:hypothetical protein
MHARFEILCLLAVMSLAGGRSVAEDKFDFRTHFYFKHMPGEWVTEGEFKGADGNVIKLKEEWKAEVLGDNTLVIEGRRQLNDDSQNYKWTITHNPDTGLFEAAYRISDDNPETLRFEINLSEAEMKMEMTGFLGSGNGKAVIVDTFSGNDRDTFKGEVTLTDDSGVTTLSGTLKSTRTKKQP